MCLVKKQGLNQILKELYKIDNLYPNIGVQEVAEKIENWRCETCKMWEVLKYNKLDSGVDVKTKKAMFYIEKYALSHSMELADALVGASAVIKQMPLITGNARHYKHLPEIKIKEFQIES